MRNPFKRWFGTSRKRSDRDDDRNPLAFLDDWREEEESENRAREAFMVSALWLADRLRPAVKLLAVAYVWLRQVWRFVSAPLRGHGLQAALKDLPELDTSWQPASEILAAARRAGGMAAADPAARAAVAAMERWFGPAPEQELVVLHQGVLHLRGPGYRLEIGRVPDWNQPREARDWKLEDFSGTWIPRKVRLKMWRVVRLHDPVTGRSTGLWLLRGEPDADGTVMRRKTASEGIQQARWLKVTGSVFGRLGQMDDMDKVDRDDMLQVLRGDPDMSRSEMFRIRFNSRQILMRAMAENVEQSNAWFHQLHGKTPEIDRIRDQPPDGDWDSDQTPEDQGT